MKLTVSHPAASAHSELVAAVAWSSLNELFTGSDDHSICRWSSKGDFEGKVCVLDPTSVTDLQWLPSTLGRQHTGGDVFAVACTDGTFKLITRAGRIEKSVDAHQGAVLRLRWSIDGSALATAGEDGQLRIWSRSGMPRATLTQTDSPIHALAWGRSGAALAFSSGAFVTVKPLQGAGSGGGPAVPPAAATAPSSGSAPRAAPSGAGAGWKAHDGVVLALDWSPVTGLLVTGGEEGRYKVWDAFGRLLFQSAALDHPVCSAAWAPGGQRFAVGTFNAVALCDRAGWAHAKTRVTVGSVLGLAWSVDGARLAACGGSGIALARVVDQRLEDGRVAAVVRDERRVDVADMLGETKEVLQLKDPIVTASLGYGHLVVATATQCYIYNTANFNTPHVFDLQQPPQLLLQCERSLLLIDAAAGMQVVTYDGRLVCNPKAAGMHPELLSPQMVSLAPDMLAALDGPGSSSVRVFDTAQGRQQGDPIHHTAEIRQIALSQAPGTAAERMLALVDTNRELHLIHPSARNLSRLASGVDAVAWHDSCPMLAAIVDGRLVVWYHPAAVFVDPGLVEATRSTHGDSRYEAGAEVVGFYGSSVVVTRTDGARAPAWVPPAPTLLHYHTRRGQWEQAVRLCRVTGERPLWAALAAAAIAAGELSAAEAAFAALGAVDKTAFARRLMRVCPERRAAELALYRRRPAEAETLLVQAGLIYRAIKLRVRMHDWTRALELAQRHRVHVDTVLLLRRRHLARQGGMAETLEVYQRAAADVAVDEVAVAEKVAEERQREGQRAAAGVGAARAGQHKESRTATGSSSSKAVGPLVQPKQ